MATVRRLYASLIKQDPREVEHLPDEARRNAPGNALRLIGASALQSSGDQIAKDSTVLPWLLHALGAPAAFTGLLVPIREAGSMLPQAAWTPLVLRVRQRKWVFVAGAAVQAAMVAAMALIAAVGRGTAAGVLVLLALALFSLGRSLCSIASKDVQGRTVAKGTRGQINGLSTTASGVVAITLGLVLRLGGGGELSTAGLAWLLAGAATLWTLAALVYATVREPVPNGAGAVAGDSSNWLASSLALLRDDAPFRRFVTVRGLLLVSALSPPFVVNLAVSAGAGALSGLGGFIVASGLSAIVAGPLFGRLADRSSRRVMSIGAAVASGVVLTLVLITHLPGFDASGAAGVAVFVGTYFVLTLVHTGVRIGRKTYVVDMAGGDQRTRYVAVSNSAIGVILLATGTLSSLLAVWGTEWALVFLAALGTLGVVGAARLPEVSAG